MSATQEPWKDADNLRKLYEDRTQGEVAEHFKDEGYDVTGSTISYWMNKLEVNTSHTSHNEEDTPEKPKCVRFDECGNTTPGPNNGICEDCLDYLRKQDRDEFQEKYVETRY